MFYIKGAPRSTSKTPLRLLEAFRGSEKLSRFLEVLPLPRGPYPRYPRSGTKNIEIKESTSPSEHMGGARFACEGFGLQIL